MISASSLHPPAPSLDMSMTDVESSVQDLVKVMKRRKRFDHLFDSNSDSQSGNSLTRFLESNPIRIITIVLLTCDLILTILELSSSIVSCSRSHESRSREVRHRFYHWAGTAIVSILLTKSVALAVGLGVSFFKRPGYLLDGVVLVLALVLEVGFEESGGGLIVVVSLWRVVRIVEGAFELSDEAIERKIEVILSQLEVVKEENMALKNEMKEKERAISELQQELSKYQQAAV
uniref:Voltage-gated hydrogen channel 1 n=1 Tax=Kalanchoe fedtschenkoi TaxID=63787 RepID=A0A7N0TJD3_KALFE